MLIHVFMFMLLIIPKCVVDECLISMVHVFLSIWSIWKNWMG
jgi:hypothetical protein